MSDAAEKRADRILAQEYDWLQWAPEVRAEVRLLIAREINAAVHEAINPPKPDCHKCRYRGWGLSGSHHLGCCNPAAKVRGNAHGVRNGWFTWPFDFDPIWLEACDGFQEEYQRKKENEHA